MTTLGSPPKGLRGHSANLIGDKLYIFGGYDGFRRSNQMMILDLDKLKWSMPCFEDLSEAPTGRQRHSSTYCSTNKLILFGGFDGFKWLTDLYELDVAKINQIALQSENLKSLSNNLFQNLFDKPEFSDYCFVVDGKPIFTHKAILGSQSDHFKALFSNGMKETHKDKLIIKDWNYEPFYHVIAFFYSASLSENLSFQSYLEILQIADAYAINGLKTLCEHIIALSIKEENACEILEIAQKFSGTELKNQCMSYIIGNFSKIYGTKQYERLEKNPSLLIEVTRSVFSNLNMKTMN